MKLAKTSTETLMIASDIKRAGFGVQLMDDYNVARVFLTRNVAALPWQVRRALEQSGYEPCQYRITHSRESVYVRANSPS